MKGRKPIPSHLKIVTGKPGRIRPSKLEPRPSGDLTTPPDDLTEEQAELWRYAISNAPAGLLKRLDASVLRVWVVAHCLYTRAVAAQEKQDAESDTPLIVVTPNGAIQQSPLIGVINRQALIMLKAASDLGFTPSSRSRVTLSEEDAEKQADPAAEFFR